MGKKTLSVKERPMSDLEIWTKAGLFASAIIHVILWVSAEIMLGEYRDDSIRDGFYNFLVFLSRFSLWVAAACFLFLLAWVIIEEVQDSKKPKKPTFLA